MTTIKILKLLLEAHGRVHLNKNSNPNYQTYHFLTELTQLPRPEISLQFLNVCPTIGLQIYCNPDRGLRFVVFQS